MGSLNGDIMVMRNGRSTSQISVYNYPEHLNPFYEDDQHKRLRFWKISKNENDGRRNSFSFGNLRDMWTFKSFRSKKKSSTLGITKTSESPPPLRRDFGAANNGWNTFDNRLRHSTASGMSGDNFQRNATYRSSLQTLPTNTDRIGFNRNDDYRSTIQVPRPNPRFRPQPLTPQAPGLRSSMTSTGSTNPFDSDEDDLVDNTAMRSINGGSTSTLSKATPRKKRKAPAPPTPIHGRTPIICIDSSQNNAQSDDLCIREDSDIAHLTAEIETFVKDKSNEDIEIEIKSENKTKNATKIVKDEEPTTVTNVVVTNTTNTSEAEKTQVTHQIDVKSPPPPKEIRKNFGTPKTQSPTSTNTTVPSLSNVQSQTESKEVTLSEATPKLNPPTPLKRDIDINNTAISASETISNSTTAAKPELPPKLHSPKKIESTSNKPTTAASEVTLTSNTSAANGNEFSKDSSATKLSSPKDNLKTIQVIESIKISTANPPTTIPHTNDSVETEIKSSRAKNSNENNNSIPVTPVSENESKIEITQELKSNGAIPKTLNTTTQVVVSELSIKENDSQVSQRPVPMKRASKTDAEHGQVECIHVHVGSPRATPREDQSNRLSSFKKDQTHDNAEVITTKTPFILTSPPAQRKSLQETKQAVEIGNAYVVPKANAAKALHIQENSTNTKPEIKPKPPLSPKPVVERNGQVHNFAEIHKPIRSKVNQTANGHVRQVRQEEMSPSLLTEPQQQLEKEELYQQTYVKENVEGFENNKYNLVITEAATTVTTNHENISASSAETPTSNSSSVLSAVSSKAETEAEVEALYRPRPQSHLEWKQSTLAPLEEHIPPEKRKSVKDIIESINRSQRLLQAAANKDFTIVTTVPAEPQDEPTTHQENLQMLEENQREIKRIIREIDEVSTAPPSYSECVRAQKLDNSEIFKKCKVNKEVYDYRETSPITSNLDWNPVPKPKRTKAPNE